jgi:hypothetical protein
MSKLDNEKDRDNIKEKVSEWQKTLLNHRKQPKLGGCSYIRLQIKIYYLALLDTVFEAANLSASYFYGITPN